MRCDAVAFVSGPFTTSAQKKRSLQIEFFLLVGSTVVTTTLLCTLKVTILVFTSSSLVGLLALASLIALIYTIKQPIIKKKKKQVEEQPNLPVVATPSSTPEVALPPNLPAVATPNTVFEINAKNIRCLLGDEEPQKKEELLKLLPDGLKYYLEMEREKFKGLRNRDFQLDPAELLALKKEYDELLTLKEAEEDKLERLEVEYASGKNELYDQIVAARIKVNNAKLKLSECRYLELEGAKCYQSTKEELEKLQQEFIERLVDYWTKLISMDS